MITAVLLFLLGGVSAWAILRAHRLASVVEHLYPMAWLLAAFWLFSGALLQGVGWAAGWSKTGLHLIALSSTALSLLSLGLGAASLFIPNKLANLLLLPLLLGAAVVVGAVMIEGDGQALNEYRPGQGLHFIRLVALFGEALFLFGSVRFAWQPFWDSASPDLIKRMAGLFAGSLLLTFSVLWIFSTPQDWLQVLLSLLGVCLFAPGFGFDLARPAPGSLSKKALARHQLKLRAWGVGGMLTFLFGTLMLMPVFPVFMGILGDVPQPLIYLPEMPAGVSGAYLLTEQGTLPLYEWYMPLQQAPRDSAVLSRLQIQQVVVAQKVLYPASDYQLYWLETGQRMAWQMEEQQDTRLLLKPANLPVGSFMLVVPTNGMFGGENFYYFKVSE